MRLVIIIISTLFICERISPVLCSLGDRSMPYVRCLSKCYQDNCIDYGEYFKSNSAVQQDFWSKLLMWSCRDECCYQCMWSTIKLFQKTGEEVPKFHGRWPFVRFLGMQEPAAAFASMLNFAANAYMYKKICNKFPVSKFTRMPIIIFWHLFALVCMNAWFWSTVFHMRDTPFTEFMDYACALSMVMGLFVASIVRAFYKKPHLVLLILFVPLLYFVTHLRYLYTGAINYDYNMVLNIFFGVAGSVIWMAMSWYQWLSGRRFAWRMLAFTALSGAALFFELIDFPPKFNTWDSHALWHLSTAPLPLLFYQYVIDDLSYLQTKESEMLKLNAYKLT